MDPLQLYSPYDDFSTRRTDNPLSPADVSALFDDFAHAGPSQFVLLEELQTRLVQVYKALVRHGVDDKIAAERAYAETEGLQIFLRSLVPSGKTLFTRSEFIELVHSWNVPSRRHANDDAGSASSTIPWHRRLCAFWSLRGPKIVFVSLVVLLQATLGLQEGIKFATDPEALAAFGWGVVVAKTCAGVLYPTMMFLLLSMSRWATTWLRRLLPYGNVINWDRSRSFHIWMACSAVFFGTVHGLAHLAGTFDHASRPENRSAVVNKLPFLASRGTLTYGSFFTLLPLWTGLASVALFVIISALATPRVRKWNYEVFQASHLLMFPLLVLLGVHGLAQLLEPAKLSWWMLVPVLLIGAERTTRFSKAASPLPARITILDKDAVTLTCKNPSARLWQYQAGQFIFLNIPTLSRFQWHPFTVSSCTGSELQLHIKTDGNWTTRLRSLPASVSVAIDGPYGAPSQRFYEFDHAIVIGTGVGITPFSAILTDLEQKLSAQVDPWDKTAPGLSRPGTAKSIASISPPLALLSTSAPAAAADDAARKHQSILLPPAPLRKLSVPTAATKRRVSLHWLVRDASTLSWFASLLNRARALSMTSASTHLSLQVTAHITSASHATSSLTAHVFSYLLDSYRTPTSPVSVISGLASRSQFGRPDWRGVLESFHRGLAAQHTHDGESEREHKPARCVRVGVFFCGAPAVAQTLQRECALLNRRCMARGENVRYEVLVEVFG